MAETCCEIESLGDTDIAQEPNVGEARLEEQIKLSVLSLLGQKERNCTSLRAGWP